MGLALAVAAGGRHTWIRRQGRRVVGGAEAAGKEVWHESNGARRKEGGRARLNRRRICQHPEGRAEVSRRKVGRHNFQCDDKCSVSWVSGWGWV